MKIDNYHERLHYVKTINRVNDNVVIIIIMTDFLIKKLKTTIIIL